MSGNPTLFLAPLNGSLAFQDRSGGGTLTGSGAVRYAPAEGARTNYFTNPSFEAGTTGWSSNGGTASITRITTDGAQGSACLEIAATTLNHGGQTTNGAGPRFNNPGTYTVSFYAKLVSGASDWYWVLGSEDASGGGYVNESGNQSVTVTSSWQRFSASVVVDQTGAHRARFYLSRATTAASTIRVDGFQLETGSTATDYFDGSTGGVWLDPLTGILGTAHASPSVSQAVAWVEEATTNLHPNPSFENAALNNVVAVSSATVTKDTTYALLGSASCKAVTPNAVSGEGVNFTTASSLGYTGSARTFTGQLRIRGSGTVDVYTFVRYADATFDNLAGTIKSSVTVSDTWQLVTPGAITVNSAKTVDYIAVTVRTQTQQASTFYVDCVQIEEKAYATSYCDGSIGTGYAWSGTAHASSSTRTAATLYRPWSASLVNTVRGHVALRESPRDNLAINGRGLFIVSRWNLDLDDHISMSYNAATFTGRFETNGSGASMVESLIVANEWKLIWMAWDANSLYMGNGSSQTDTTARAVAAAGTVNAGQPTVYFGADPAGSHHNGYIGPVLIADRPLTAKERATLNARTSWAWATLGGGGILRRGRVLATAGRR